MVSVKNLAFGIAIFVVTILVVVSGTNTLYKQPKWEDYCNNTINVQINNSADCDAVGGVWNPSVAGKSPAPVTEPYYRGYCDMYAKCQKEFDKSNEVYYKKVFFTAIPIGIVIIAIGALVFGLEFVGAGLMLGGVGSIIYGIGSYWRYTENWLRFFISIVGLIVLIWLSYYFNRKFGNKTVVKKKANKKR